MKRTAILAGFFAALIFLPSPGFAAPAHTSAERKPVAVGTPVTFVLPMRAMNPPVWHMTTLLRPAVPNGDSGQLPLSNPVLLLPVATEPTRPPRNRHRRN